MDQIANHPAAFGKFRPACKANGIGATAAYELAAAGLLKPFKIGNATYIEFSEFEQLPERLKDPKAISRLATIKRDGTKVAS
jgi:hypothetical protein